MDRRNLLWAGLASLTSTVIAAGEPGGFALDGENWRYEGDGLHLTGILFKPDGLGPFPAMMISHGAGGNFDGFSAPKAREMVKWGLVCIATDYTFSGRPGVPRAPAGTGSEENIRRAAKCVEILSTLAYVDSKRICAYGNSAGAVISAALAGRMPERLAAVAITGGGMVQREAATVTPQLAKKIRCPFLILHGSADNVAKPEISAQLKQILDGNQVRNERILFDGVGHNLHSDKAQLVYGLIRAWLRELGVLR